MELKLPEIKIIKKHPRVALSMLIVFFLGIAWLIEQGQKPKINVQENTPDEALDTFIPDGFVLVPIEIQNLSALESMVGQYGVVDLYAGGQTPPIARGIRLIRSPRDPSQFAVLVPQEHSHEIAKASLKPMQVVVQNPNQKKIEIRRAEVSSKIIWEN